MKGPGDVPTESARNSRKGVRQATDTISRSAGSNSTSSTVSQPTNGNVGGVGGGGGSSSRYKPQMSEEGAYTTLPPAGPPPPQSHHQQPPLNTGSMRLDAQSQERVRLLCAQMRHADFRERIKAIETFQSICELEPHIAQANLVPIFDKFNSCLTESNSKVNYQALQTMCQITPILYDELNPVLPSTVPIIAQHLASKNSEIQDMASNVLDVMVEYLGTLIRF